MASMMSDLSFCKPMAKESRDSLDTLDAYYISPEYGYLLPAPMTFLPESFAEWNDIALHLTDFITDGSIRRKVEQMSVLDHGQLTSHRELRLAHLMLTGIAAAYVWTDGVKGVPKILPRSVAVPLWRVSERLGVQPVVSHCSWSLANWKIIDQSKPATDLKNRELIVTLPGGDTTKWFFLIPQQADLIGGLGITHAMAVKQAVLEGDEDHLVDNLNFLKSTVNRMEECINQTHELCDPEIFFHVLRQFIMGFGSQPFMTAGHGGLIFEGISDVPQKHLGDSAAQSPAVPIFDAALGVIHDDENENFHETMRQYMQPVHRKLIEDLRKGPSTKTFVDKCSNEKTKKAYNDCLQALADFRSCHLKIVVRFITIPLRKAEERKAENVIAEGTGGSDVLNYLKSTRSATTDAMLKATANAD
ncbi:indoleamine 2,3-dioxygenase 2-like [Ptychodera flava]|uniref:indoleamine 2,3-dioxygenase 2-like n=1 Tax=Ptychodera flava TaxID=63121 RepID=UPI00396A03B9